MKRLILAGFSLAALSLTALSPAQAQGGCGPFAHRGWNGYCRPNVGPVVGPVGYGYGWHRPLGYGWHRPWGWHRW